MVILHLHNTGIERRIQPARLWTLDSGQGTETARERVRQRDSKLANWKVSPVVHYLKFPSREADPRDADGDLYQERRIWWRTVDELDILKRGGADMPPQ